MKPVVLLFICVFMMLLCGCQSWCGRYEAQHKLRSPEVYPFRFHIKELRLEAEHYASQEACVVKSKILKQNLLKNYPQYFSDKSSRTLPLEFTIKRLGNKAIQTEKSKTGGALLTFGLIPIQEFFKREWMITAEAAGQKVENKLILKLRYSTVISPLGLLFQTHRWGDPMPGSHLTSNDYKGFIRVDSEYFWIFFLDAVASFDRNKLQEYYYSKISPNMRLLE